jgi:hypothetical protein
MGTVFAVLGLGLSFAMIKFRESIGNSLGQADWMLKVGGIYNVIVICAILMFFWSVSYLTGTQDVFLAPILKLFPTANRGPAEVPQVF